MITRNADLSSRGRQQMPGPQWHSQLHLTGKLVPIWRSDSFEHRPTADIMVKARRIVFRAQPRPRTTVAWGSITFVKYLPCVIPWAKPFHLHCLYFILFHVISSSQQPSEVGILPHHYRWWNRDPVRMSTFQMHHGSKGKARIPSCSLSTPPFTVHSGKQHLFHSENPPKLLS